ATLRQQTGDPRSILDSAGHVGAKGDDIIGHITHSIGGNKGRIGVIDPGLRHADAIEAAEGRVEARCSREDRIDRWQRVAALSVETETVPERIIGVNWLKDTTDDASDLMSLGAQVVD